MATIREYFDTDPGFITLHNDWIFSSPSSDLSFRICAKIAYDFEANAKFWYVFTPELIDPFIALNTLLNMRNVNDCNLKKEGDGVEILMSEGNYSEQQSTSTLIFTKRIHFYVDADLSKQKRSELVSFALSKGFYLCVNEREYARVRSENEFPLAFISHDTRDKDALVRELA